MKPSTVVVLGLGAFGLAMVCGVYDSFAEEDEGIIALLAGLINNIQTDVEEVKMRVAELEAVNTELVRRISDLEHRLLNMTTPNAACDPGYQLNPDTNACVIILQEGAPACGPGYRLNPDTNACETIRQGEAPACDPAFYPGYRLNPDTNACEKIRQEGAPACDPGYYLDAEGTCVIIRQGETPACGPGYYLNADTNACEAIQQEGAPACDPGYYLDADTGTCVIIQNP